MSGPPGIGKTTAAHLIAKLAGYNIIEMNASDTRSKKLLEVRATVYVVREGLISPYYRHSFGAVLIIPFWTVSFVVKCVVAFGPTIQRHVIMFQRRANKSETILTFRTAPYS